MKLRALLLATTILAATPLLAMPAHAEDGSEIASLRKENAKLQKDLASLMSRLDKIEAKATASAEKADAAVAASEKATTASEKVVTVTDDGAFKIPGTGTTIKVGGYAKLDFLHDFSSRPTSAGGSTSADAADFAAIPTSQDSVLGSRKNANRIDARETRLKVLTSTPTSYGPVNTVVEMDFFGGNGNALLTNSYAPRLRKAYGQFAGFTLGQDWSTFVDLDVVPETLDFNGPAGGTTMRQGLIRYTKDFKNGHAMLFAIENSESDYTDQSGATDVNSINRYPDFVAGWRYDNSDVHVGLRGLARNVGFDSGKTATAPIGDKNEWGYGVSGSFKWMPFASSKGKAVSADNFFLLAQGGKGIGRYLLESAELGGAVNTATASLSLQNAYGGNVGYQHFWTGALRSTVVYGHTYADLEGFLPADTTKETQSIHANLVWSPVKSVDLGVEYIFGRREVKGGADGEMNRVQASAKYNF